MASKASSGWTIEDQRLLLEMHQAGRSWYRIAAVLRRTHTSVRSQYYKLYGGRSDADSEQSFAVTRAPTTPYP